MSLGRHLYAQQKFKENSKLKWFGRNCCIGGEINWKTLKVLIYRTIIIFKHFTFYFRLVYITQFVFFNNNVSLLYPFFACLFYMAFFSETKFNCIELNKSKTKKFMFTFFKNQLQNIGFQFGNTLNIKMTFSRTLLCIFPPCFNVKYIVWKCINLLCKPRSTWYLFRYFLK